MWKDFFYFSRRERQGIIILIVLIAGVFLGKLLFSTKVSAPAEVDLVKEKSSEKKEVVLENAKEQNVQKSYAPPNRNTSNQAAKSNQLPEKRTFYPSAAEQRVNPKQNQYPATEKFPAGTVIDINSSDTLQLMKIPGIGAAFAKRITSYRKMLGGFYRLEQLQEVYGMYEELYEKIIPYLQTDTEVITPISVNSASLDKLRSHPYINFYQAKAIIEIRKKKGKLESIDQLKLLEEFTEEDLERIKHYLIF